MRLRGFTILAISGLLAVGGASHLANAQTFILESGEAAPGSTVDLQLLVNGGPVDTSALNFTVRYDADQVSAISGARGTAPGISSSYIYDEHSPSQTEYRGVLYAVDNTVPPFSTASNAHVATLSVTLSNALEDGESVILTLVNSFDDDGITGLLGLGDSSGTSIVPGSNPAQSRPAATNGVITAVAGPLVDEDFTGTTDPVEGWNFTEFPVPQFGHSGAAGLSAEQTNDGFRVTIANNNPNPGRATDTIFGRFETTGDPIIPDAGSMLLMSAEFSSDAESPEASAFVRFSTQAQNFAYTTKANIKEVDAAPPYLLPSGGATATHRVAAYIPQYIVDPIDDGQDILQGIDLAFDVVSNFVPGGLSPAVEGDSITLKRITVDQLPVAAAEEGTVVFDETFTGGNAGGFNNLVTQLVDENGVNVGENSVADSSEGLSLFHAVPEGAVTNDLALALGWWDRVLDFEVQAGKYYRFDAEVATTAANPQFSHTFRMRLGAVGTNLNIGGDYNDLTIISPITQAADGRPTAEGKEYTTVSVFPEEAIGQNVYFAFDVYTLTPVTNGAIILKSLRVTEHDLPNGSSGDVPMVK